MENNPVYLSVGIGAGGSDQTYDIRNITLYHATDPEKNVTTMTSGYNNLFFGQGGERGGRSRRTIKADLPSDRVPIIVLAEQGDTLFEGPPGTQSWPGYSGEKTPEKFEYDNKQWWIVGDARAGQGFIWDDDPTDENWLAVYNDIKDLHTEGYSRLRYVFPIAEEGFDSKTSMTIFYEMKDVSTTNGNGSLRIIARNTADGGGGTGVDINNNLILEEGEGMSFTLPIAPFVNNAISIVKMDIGVILFRVTEIVFE